jgi:hypothetical protein
VRAGTQRVLGGGKLPVPPPTSPRVDAGQLRPGTCGAGLCGNRPAPRSGLVVMDLMVVVAHEGFVFRVYPRSAAIQLGDSGFEAAALAAMCGRLCAPWIPIIPAALPQACRYLLWYRTRYGESNNLGEMGADVSVVCRRFLLPSHPR